MSKYEIRPAQLSFLAIYNPSLGATEETLSEQIVFCHEDEHPPQRRQPPHPDTSGKIFSEEQNGRLRRIGLAQGMVEFARTFSPNQSLEVVETEQSRIILHELESGWWVLASVDLTRLPLQPQHGTGVKSASPRVEYSAREVCTPALVLQGLRRSHSVFLLHHGSNLSELYARLGRKDFCDALDQFWTPLAESWDMLLHGNPAIEIFDGVKLAAGGELGIGVGEEEWGSGERDVLEGLVARTPGLVDLIVSRFEEAFPVVPSLPASTQDSVTTKSERGSSPHEGNQISVPLPSDGVIFSGVKGISKTSLAALTSWLAWVVSGDQSHGVHESVNTRMRRRREQRPKRTSAELPRGSTSHRVPPPIVKGSIASNVQGGFTASGKRATVSQHDSTTGIQSNSFPTETLMKYLTLGYGSTWGGPSKDVSPEQNTPFPQSSKIEGAAPDSRLTPEPNQEHASWEKSFFLVGLRGGLELNELLQDEDDRSRADTDHDWGPGEAPASRITSRTVHVEVMDPQARDRSGDHAPKTLVNSNISSDGTRGGGDGGTPSKRLRLVIYSNQPFIFALLFEPETPSLAMRSFYRTLHQQLKALHGPLQESTSPQNVMERISGAEIASEPASDKSRPVYSLVYDPFTCTVHSSIPNIPRYGSTKGAGTRSPEQLWTRIEALNVHKQILNTYSTTRGPSNEMERTCKTSRGWWVVWLRLPAAEGSRHHQEAFLIRKSTDEDIRKASGASGLESAVPGPGSEKWALGKLTEGIGIDSKKYVQGLLSLNR
ncbi:MAG: hypothetical protein M1817_006063 [Caeruleum heppii]|nr:MAG: hypothetical protein M1817_006063 [Caeruleum heppii]